jgi:hypothetical protein
LEFNPTSFVGTNICQNFERKPVDGMWRRIQKTENDKDNIRKHGKFYKCRFVELAKFQ